MSQPPWDVDTESGAPEETSVARAVTASERHCCDPIGLRLLIKVNRGVLSEQRLGSAAELHPAAQPLLSGPVTVVATAQRR